ncbi:MAG: DUF3341 domain-containing protein [SAR324 cluster bacterium]|nr:DUF3341 domain-containing protein [SAR324 cluster bacterium]
MSRFRGVWGTFAHLDATTDTIEQVRDKGVQPTVLSPCPRHEIDHALGDPQSIVPWVGLAFGALGTLIGFAFPAWTASDWVLPVSGKPIVAIPPFAVIGFELTILFAAIHTLIGLSLLAVYDSFKYPIPAAVKRYLRFQRDRFGVVVRCDSAQAEEFAEILRRNGAEEVHVEND